MTNGKDDPTRRALAAMANSAFDDDLPASEPKATPAPPAASAEISDATLADFAALGAMSSSQVVFPDSIDPTSVVHHGLSGSGDTGTPADTGTLPVGYVLPAGSAKVRVRKVRRTIRRVEVFSVARISFILYLCLYAVALIAGLILWHVAHDAGVIKTIERFVKSSTTSTGFRLHGRSIFRACAIGGLFLVALGTVLTSAAVLLFNLVSDLVGGLRVSVVEDEALEIDGYE